MHKENKENETQRERDGKRAGFVTSAIAAAQRGRKNGALFDRREILLYPVIMTKRLFKVTYEEPVLYCPGDFGGIAVYPMSPADFGRNYADRLVRHNNRKAWGRRRRNGR